MPERPRRKVHLRLIVNGERIGVLRDARLIAANQLLRAGERAGWRHATKRHVNVHVAQVLANSQGIVEAMLELVACRFHFAVEDFIAGIASVEVA